MKDFFDFLRRYSRWLILLIYVVISCCLLSTSDPYRHQVWLSSASSFSGALYKAGHNITSFFSLRQTNDDLNRRNAELQAEVANLREQLQQARLKSFTDTMITPDSVAHFDFVVANVVNNSIHRPQNYLTLDKGSLDGIAPEMGVIDHSGVAGIVSTVGPHYCRVISLLNPNFRLSCKIKGSEHFGSLVWDGVDPKRALLEELPRHTVFAPGDTVVTSGYSAVFPAGLPVGIILPDNGNHSENFFTLPVKLLADFSRMSNVQIVINNNSNEIASVEKQIIVSSDPSAK